MEQPKRTFYFSVLSVAACLGVVILHCNGVFWMFPKGRLWVTANLIETLFYWPVPVFFMLTGATLMDYRNRYSTKQYFLRRLLKAFIPFLFWSMVGVLYVCLTGDGPFSILEIVQGIFNTSFVNVYWFFIPLFAVYLSLPLLSAIQDKMSVFRYAIPASLLFVCCLPLVCSLLGIRYNTALTPPAVGGYLLFPILGYYLANHDFSKKERLIVYALGVLGWAAHFFGTHFLSAGKDAIDQTFKGYTNLPSVLQAAAVFLGFKSVGFSRIAEKKPRLRVFVDRLSGLTLGVYLCHIYLVMQLPGLLSFDATSILWRTAGAVMLFVVCAVCVWIAQKLPFIRRIVP